MREITVIGDSNDSEKTNGNNEDTYLSDDDYFMGMAALTAQRSKDPVTQVGATVVDKHGNLIGVGYNGMPRGCHDDDFPWCKNSSNTLENKHFYVCHAEMNAISNCNGIIRGGTIYVTLFPCSECAKLIIQNGIREIIYLSDKHANKNTTIAAKIMLNSAGVVYRQFRPKPIIIQF